MNFSHTKLWALRPALLAGLLGLCLWPAAAWADEKIPALSPIPFNLHEDERLKFAAQRQSLHQQFTDFQAAAKAFNGKSADNQTDEEFNAVEALRKSYIGAAREFNQSLSAAAAAVPNTDAMVVDARRVWSGLDQQTEKWLESYSAVPGVSDRLRKAWQAFKTNDLNVANAWFEDALNLDPKNPGIKFLVDRCHRQQQLVDSQAFNDAIVRSLDTYHPADDPAVERAAARKIWKPEGLLVLPKDSDIELMFPDLNQDAQIRDGLALPEKDAQLNDTLKEHPELKPQLLAAWKNACVDRDQGEFASMAAAVRHLATTASALGLPAGHFEEALARDPGLKAQWQAAVEKAGNAEFFGEADAALTAIGTFDVAVQRLRESASHPQNSANPYELK